MKKFLSIFMCLVLVLSMSVIFASCDETDEPATTTAATTTAEATTTATTTGSTTAATTTAATTATTAPAPEGYELYVNAGVVFAYPEGWTKNDASGIITSPNGQSNIVVTYEDATDVYHNLSADEFAAVMEPTYSTIGMSMSNVTARTEVSNGLSIRVFKFNTTVIAQNATMTQTLFVVTLGTRTYSVALSENTPDEAIANTIIATLRAA